jgi:serine protease Do
MEFMSRRVDWKMVAVVLVIFAVGLLTGSAFTGKTISGSPATPPLTRIEAPDQAINTEISFQSGFAPIVAKDLPAVVNISSSKIVRSQTMPLFDDPFFQRFFGRQFQIPREQRAKSLGSGVIVSPDGYILTNNHVVEGASDITVALADKREFQAKTVGTDPRTDIAVLKVNASNLPVLPLGDSARVRVGEFAIAIGNPFGIGQTVTMGIISAIGRGNLGIEDYEDFIQTDAAINPGNSGGALVDSHGDLIGINTAILSGQGGGGNQGIGFAIPVNMARQVMDQILKTGKVTRGYLGAWIQPITPELAKAFNLKQSGGALLSDLEPGGPAAKAGLQRGDIVLALNGQSVADNNSFRLKVSMTPPGSTLRLKVLRNGSEMDVPVTVGEMPAKDDSAAAGSEQRGGTPSAALKGLTVDELTPQLARQLGLPARTSGIVITDVEAGTPAERAGLSRGDIIQEINRRQVTSLRDFDQLTRGLGNQPVLLLINRGGNTIFAVVQP